MRLLLLATAVIAIATGRVLLARPGSVLAALLGLSEPAPEAAFVGRLAGAALLAIGVGCAIAANDRGGRWSACSPACWSTTSGRPPCSLTPAPRSG